MDVAISAARTGNVIGGGGFAADRIIPDCIRAAEKKEDIIVRNPFSTRLYEHVLEPVVAYLMIAMRTRSMQAIIMWDQTMQTVGQQVSLMDCSKLKNIFGWRPRWNVEAAMEKAMECFGQYLAGEDVVGCMESQIEDFLNN